MDAAPDHRKIPATSILKIKKTLENGRLSVAGFKAAVHHTMHLLELIHPPKTGS
jgi:hypothetical protein